MRNLDWQSYLASVVIQDAARDLNVSTDALDHSMSLDVDSISASEIDPVAYHEISACASLDDEIDSWDRV